MGCGSSSIDTATPGGAPPSKADATGSASRPPPSAPARPAPAPAPAQAATPAEVPQRPPLDDPSMGMSRGAVVAESVESKAAVVDAATAAPVAEPVVPATEADAPAEAGAPADAQALVDAVAEAVDEGGVDLSLDLQQAHSDPTKVVCGYLAKRGDSFTAFKERYVVLDGGVLSYYNKETDYDRKSKPKKDRAIPLKYYAVVRGPVETKFEDGQLNFQLVPIVSREEAAEVGLPGSKKSKLRVFVFRAAKQQDRDDWMRCFFQEQCHTEHELRSFLDAQTFKDLRVPEGPDPCEALRLARDGPVTAVPAAAAAAAAAAASSTAEEAEPAGDVEPAASAEPAGDVEPAASAEPEADVEPAASAEPEGEVEPAASAEPAAAVTVAEPETATEEAATEADVDGSAVVAEAEAASGAGDGVVSEPEAAESAAAAVPEPELAEAEPAAYSDPDEPDAPAAAAAEAEAATAKAATSTANSQAAGTEAEVASAEATSAAGSAKMGTMMKKGEKNNKWDSRGLKLLDGKLTYLKNGRPATSKRNPIAVSSVKVVPPSLLVTDAAARARVSAKKGLTLAQEGDKSIPLTEEQTATLLVLTAVSGNGKAFYLDAASPAERDDWAAAIIAEGSSEAGSFSG